jgi:predicted small metal-binding protein
MPYEFACADAGCTCNAAWTEATPDAIVAKVAIHLQAEHNVHTISKTLANFVQSAIRRT